MAVVTKYVVVRNGVELDKPFIDRKTAEAYDKMLDAADNLAAYIKNAGLEINLDGRTIDALAVFLAQNGPEVTRILKGLQPVASSPEASPAGKDKDDGATADEKKRGSAAKTKPRGK
jgi:hypothetical protein